MGTEKDLTVILLRQIKERRGISPAGLRRAGGTPNHKALARCVGYGWGLAAPEDREEGRGLVLEFLREQRTGHMAFASRPFLRSGKNPPQKKGGTPARKSPVSQQLGES